MSQKQIDAILWRRYLTATSHAVWQVSASQYYFELPDRGYEKFFAGNCRAFVDKDGNDAFSIILEDFEGDPPVGQHEVIFTKKRASASRQGKWTVDSIRDGRAKAYDLWRQRRGPVDRFENLPADEKSKNFILIVRDLDGRFHGRWIRGSDFDLLPLPIKGAMSATDAGWKEL